MLVKVEVSDTGSQLTYKPGVLLGGKVEHQCSLERGIGYWLEPILALAPFCKDPLHLVLTGVTNNQQDPSPDWIKASCLPILRRFLTDDTGLELIVSKRGAAPGGGGQVVFKCPVRKSLRPVQLTDQGKIKRVRGVAWAVRVSPATANRVVESAKGELLKFLPDVYIYTDHFTGAKSGKSPGFGLTLTAETTTGCFLTAEVQIFLVQCLFLGACLSFSVRCAVTQQVAGMVQHYPKSWEREVRAHCWKKSLGEDVLTP